MIGLPVLYKCEEPVL